MLLYATIVQTLGFLALLAIAMVIVLGGALALPHGRAWLQSTLTGNERHLIGWAWAVALIAMSGSLYLSDVAGLLPCKLCWFQRIAMYPLVLVLGVGLLKGDAGVWRFALPLPLVGFVISAYHVMVQYQPSLELVTCDANNPCSVRYLAVFGFISIPAMAGAAFLVIAVLLLTIRSVESAEASYRLHGGTI